MSESFNEQELFALLEDEEKKITETEEEDRQYEVAHELLWSAIEVLEIDTHCGPDLAGYKEEFDELEACLLSTIDSDMPQEDRELVKQQVRAQAQDMWDNDCRTLDTITHAIEAQLFPTEETTQIETIKKTLMAMLMAKGENTDRWFPLIDYVLEGEPLNFETPEDMDILARALEIEANADATPEAELYNRILGILGAPEPGTVIDDPIEFQRLDHLTLVARDLTEITSYLPGDSEQPNRHEKLNQLLREYDITDKPAIKLILQLTDAFACAD